MTTLAVAAVGAIAFFVQDWISKTGSRAVPAETVYHFSPARYCLAPGQTGRTAAVVQNLAEDTGQQPSSPHTRAYTFNLSTTLNERFWRADFNSDGRVDSVIDEGLVIYLHGRDARRGELFDPPSDAIAFAGTHLTPTAPVRRWRGLQDPLGEHPGAMYVVPARLLHDIAQQTVPLDVFGQIGLKPGGTAGDENTARERLRLWQAALLPATPELPPGRAAPSSAYQNLPPEREPDREAIEFGWEIKINDAGRCWTLTASDGSFR